MKSKGRDQVGVEWQILRGFVGHHKNFGFTQGEMGRYWRVWSREVIMI